MDAQEYISRKIKILRDEGYPEKQAIAIAYNIAREMGYRVRSKADPRTVTTKKGKKARKSARGAFIEGRTYRTNVGPKRRSVSATLRGETWYIVFLDTGREVRINNPHLSVREAAKQAEQEIKRRASMKHPKPKNGYGYHSERKTWKSTKDDNWDIVVLGAKEIKQAEYVGHRRIDGSSVVVWSIDYGFIAQKMI